MKKTLTTLLFLAAALTLAAQPDSTLLQKTFSVGPDTKVLFSPGNLQYQPSTHLWRFASSQTETLGWQEKQSYPKYRGWIDLFSWGSALNPWRTLTLAEWTYLLSKRPNARRLYALAYVCGHYGLILLPDNWQRPKGIYMRTGPKEENYSLQRRAMATPADRRCHLPARRKQTHRHPEPRIRLRLPLLVFFPQS